MIFDSSTSDHLKPWLTKTLEPICDADPSALADYILALLKHNAPESELRKELAAQLEEFLEKEGPPFLDALFTTLRTKSYLPYNSPPPPAQLLPADNGIRIPLDAIIPSGSSSPPERGRKRQSDYADDIRPPKGPRVSQDGPFSRHGPHRGPGWSNGNWGGGGPSRAGYGGSPDDVNGAMNPRMNGRGPPTQYNPPDQRRGICRDYYNNGYCARGGFCKYSHGEDALVPGVFPMGPPQIPGNMFMPMFPPGMPFGMGPPAAYDPREARLDMPPGAPSGPMGRAQRPPRLPRVNGDSQPQHPNPSGELPVIQDLTPAVFNDESAQQPDKAVPFPVPDTQPNGISAPTSPANKMELDASTSGSPPYSSRSHRGPPSTPTRGRGGRPGVFGGEVQRFRPERRDKTLVVEKIPEDKLSLDTVNGWFKRFGTVTNVAVDAPSSKALVSFSSNEEAHAAWKSEDAVFGNRFVKVFWHRPMDGQGLAGQRALAASAPIVASVTAREQTQTGPTSDTAPADSSSSVATGPSVKKTPSTPSNPAASELAARQKLLEQQIAEQKTLMEKLNTASADEKKDIFAQLRKLGQEINATSSQTSVGPSKKPSSTQPEDREAKERERLDKELELHSVALDGEESAEALQAKLAKLKAEAASLGIDPSAESVPTYPTYPYRGRGRGRGRGFYRGAARGGPVRASMKLDNRPKKLLVQDIGSDSIQAVRDWYEAGGQVDAFETLENGDVIVTFRTRAAAEQGLAKGPNIPLVGQKQISWYNASPTAAAATTGSTEATPSKAGTTKVSGAPSEFSEEAYGREQRSGVHSLHDDEPAVIGWGGDEDEDGMGML